MRLLSHRCALTEMILAFVRLVRDKLLATVEKERITFRIFNQKTHLFDQFTFNEDQFDQLMGREIPQLELLRSMRPFLRGLLAFVSDLVGKEDREVQLSVGKLTRLGPVRSADQAVQKALRVVCHRHLDTLVYLLQKMGLDLMPLMDNLAVDDQFLMETLVHGLLSKQLRTVVYGSKDTVPQTAVLKCINRNLRSVRKLNQLLFDSLSQFLRVWLINVGTNPRRTAVYNFCIEVGQSLSFHLRFFKSSLSGFIRRIERGTKGCGGVHGQLPGTHEGRGGLVLPQPQSVRAQQ